MNDALKKFNSVGQKILAAIGNEIIAKWKWLSDSLGGAITKTVNTINSEKYDSFKTLGKQMAQGLADGITAKKDDVVTAASAVAQAAADATKTT